jgi:hypothetical protein
MTEDAWIAEASCSDERHVLLQTHTESNFITYNFDTNLSTSHSLHPLTHPSRDQFYPVAQDTLLGFLSSDEASGEWELRDHTGDGTLTIGMVDGDKVQIDCNIERLESSLVTAP